LANLRDDVDHFSPLTNLRCPLALRALLFTFLIFTGGVAQDSLTASLHVRVNMQTFMVSFIEIDRSMTTDSARNPTVAGLSPVYGVSVSDQGFAATETTAERCRSGSENG
jgi:hypothetical protein